MTFSSKLNPAITAICSLVSNAANTDKVHDGIRELADKSSYVACLMPVGGSRIHGWFVTRVASPQEIVNDGLHIRQHDISITGYYGIYDKQNGTSATSEVTWRGIVETVCQALRANPQLGGLVQDSSPPVVTTDGRATEYEFRVHQTEIRLSIFERIIL